MSQAREPTACQNCGGMMNPQWDGRTYVCPYCGVRIQVAIGADQIARGMALDLSNMDVFLARLADTLLQGFSEHSRIEGDGMRVQSIEVNLEPDVFLVRREGARPVAQHRRVVRGIALKTSTVPLDRWVEMLTQALAQHANQNARAAWVLAQISGGNR